MRFCAFRSLARPVGLLLATSALLSAAPQSQVQNIDFYRDVPSRNLQGLATRSDGRLTTGPVLRGLAGELGVDLAWDLESWRPNEWLIGTGPNGKLLAVTLDATTGAFTTRDFAQLDLGQIFVVRALPDHRVVVGGGPNGRLVLLDENGMILAEVSLPADSVFDLVASPDSQTLWAGTGNPGRIFQINVTQWIATATDHPDAPWKERGITEFGRIRDRNVRRLALAPDGAILAGSAPSGNLYRFAPSGGDPVILFDNERAEVTDIHLAANGDVYAAVVFATDTANARVTNGAKSNSDNDATKKDDRDGPATIMETPTPDQFAGRSALICLAGGDGLPETLAARNNLAFYRIVARGDVLLLAGGDNGDLVGYDTVARRSLTFPGSPAAQLTDLVAVQAPSTYLLLTNNPVGLTLVDFAATGPRRAETRRLDMRVPVEFGAVRFNRLRHVAADAITVELRANRGRDEVEGWTPWRPTEAVAGAWKAMDEPLRGQFVEARVTVPEDVGSDFEIDNAHLHYLAQNRRPVLQAFRIISPNYALVPRADSGSSSPGSLTLSQVIGGDSSSAADSARSNASFLSSPVVPQPGAQIVTWTVRDADDDRLTATFSVRRDDAPEWTDLIIDTDESWLQFDRRTLPEGTYFTRLTVTEQSPRPAADRRTITFETDDLVVDLTPPTCTETTQTAEANGLRLIITGTDERSLLEGVALAFNNGYDETLNQPSDGILDSLTEQFDVLVPWSALQHATAVEVYLTDTAGNLSTRRIPLTASR